MIENEAVSALARRGLGEGPRRPAQGRARSRRGARRQVRRGAAPIGRDAADRSRGSRPRSTSSPAAPRSAWSPPMATASSSWSPRRSAPGTRAPISDRLEGAVGRDLQYIRINGTLVGGLVGLVHPQYRGADMSGRDADLREMAGKSRLQAGQVARPHARPRRLRPLRPQGREERQARCSASARRASRRRPKEIAQFLRGDAAAELERLGRQGESEAAARGRAQAQAQA